MDTWVASAYWLLGIIAVNTGVQVSVQVSAFNSLGIERSGIAGSRGNSLFRVLRSCFPRRLPRFLFHQHEPGLRFLYSFADVYFALFIYKVYLFIFEREREHEQGRGRGEGDRIRSRLQTLSCQRRAQCGVQTHEPRDHDLSRSRTLS